MMGSEDKEAPLSTVGQGCRAKQQTSRRGEHLYKQASHSQAGSFASGKSYGELTGDFLGTESLISMSFIF